jgi:antitoxin (DNA-binding transcriptional repressor) of toxin-antitoxin stability system
MNTVTIRQVRQRWPLVEKRLAAEGELIITRDATPVATLSALRAAKSRPRKHFTKELHARWMKEIWGNHPPRIDSGQMLRELRRDRFDPSP